MLRPVAIFEQRDTSRVRTPPRSTDGLREDPPHDKGRTSIRSEMCNQVEHHAWSTAPPRVGARLSAPVVARRCKKYGAIPRGTRREPHRVFSVPGTQRAPWLPPRIGGLPFQAWRRTPASKFTGRGIDNLQHLGGRSLLLQGFARLGNQTRVLHRDDRLGGEVLP